MEANLYEFNADQLLLACACMESAIVSFIAKADRDGYDTTDLKNVLHEVHAAVDGIPDLN